MKIATPAPWLVRGSASTRRRQRREEPDPDRTQRQSSQTTGGPSTIHGGHATALSARCRRTRASPFTTSSRPARLPSRPAHGACRSLPSERGSRDRAGRVAVTPGARPMRDGNNAPLSSEPVFGAGSSLQLPARDISGADSRRPAPPERPRLSSVEPGGTLPADAGPDHGLRAGRLRAFARAARRRTRRDRHRQEPPRRSGRYPPGEGARRSSVSVSTASCSRRRGSETPTPSSPFRRR